MMPLLSIRQLSVAYSSARGWVPALRGINLSLHANECVALIGESGSGKSTLGQAIVRLLPNNSRITGTIEFAAPNPVQVLELSKSALSSYRWRNVAYVSQAALSAFNPLLRVKDHFADTARAHKLALHRETAFDLLSSVRLDPKRVWEAYPHELSGGMRQRTLLALALLLEPQILILDEPTTALDVLTQRAILEVLAQIRAQRQVAMLFISHDLGAAAEISSRICTMYAGEIVESAERDTLLAHAAHPYTAKLLRAAPSLDSSKAPEFIAGTVPDLLQLGKGCTFASRCELAQPACLEPAQLPLRPVTSSHLSACLFPEQVRKAYV